ncbi:ATP-binding protein [Amphritea sp. 2_MG-2023]|uniref:ATP-binding protein n=1 Tax=Amphritea TaxID=515417 RepID=UPI001C07A3B4|nr:MULTISPECIES: ATP-binding protein [Amphritea]MBU2964270.1 HAMP domain-containing protein [Amphritea atlantica]MDO6419472.1 ATP-binding protein [Amphritea sp. 2_MG-2023]
MSIRLKTILGVALIEGVLLLVLLLTIMEFIRESSYEALNKRATTTATLFATTTKDAVLSFDLASLESFVHEVMQNPDLVYARVLADDGTLFAEAGDTSHQLNDLFVMDHGADEIDDGVFDATAQIVEGGHRYGTVELGIGIGSINESINQVYTWGLVLASGEMLLVALFSFLLGGYLTGQLQKLREAATAVAQGVFDIEVPVSGRDEVAVVGRSFNLMASNLKKASESEQCYKTELQALNQSLEQRVAQRTEQLQNQNKQLEETLTTLKNTQQKLIQAEKMASLGTMAAGVAHEINNPVSYIKSNLGSLQKYADDLLCYAAEIEKLLAVEDGSSGPSQLAALKEEQDIAYLIEDLPLLLKESLEGITRVEEIVAGLKSFSRLDSDDMKPADINQGISSTLKLVSNQLKYHCSVHEDYGELPLVNCNLAQINQVVMNLLVNASHAIEGQGDIYIKTRCVDAQVQIEIRDTGCGMSAEVVSQLFDPFFTTKGVDQGTGLGLSISHGIVQKHGGDIQVVSELGRGSCFTVILPLDEAINVSG